MDAAIYCSQVGYASRQSLNMNLQHIHPSSRYRLPCTICGYSNNHGRGFVSRHILDHHLWRYHPPNARFSCLLIHQLYPPSSTGQRARMPKIPFCFRGFLEKRGNHLLQVRPPIIHLFGSLASESPTLEILMLFMYVMVPCSAGWPRRFLVAPLKEVEIGEERMED